MSVGRLKIWNASASAWEYVNAPDPGATQADIDAAIAALSTVYQPLDSDLAAMAALTTTSFGRAFLTIANAAAARTAIGTVIGTDVEAHDPDLTTIAGLSPTNDDLLQRKAGSWANRTIAQLLVDLAAAGTTFQPLDSDLTAIAALATTSFGRGLLALADAAAGRTALGLGTLATQSGTFSGTSSGTNTGDQTTVSGNAGTATALATGRTIDGQTFDGTANITVIAPGTHAATGKTTPVDADELPLVDSAASNVLKKLTWANLKATIKAYTDTLYPSGSGTSSGTNTGDQTISDATISTTDITTNNASTSKHGFLKKLSNAATDYMDGTGAWSVPAAAGSAGGDLTGTYPNPTLAAVGPGATGPIGTSTSIPAVTIDAKGRVTALTSITPALGIGVFGDGSDGTVTFDGTTVILGLTPSSNTYTLTRDIFLAAGTINNGVSIVPGGFRIYCQGTLTNNGTLKSNGVTASSATGANGVLNVATSSFLSTTVTTGTTGGNGGSAGVGSNGGAQNASLNALGGVGGTGGTAGASAGGGGGTLTAPTAAKGTLRAVPQASAALFILSGTTAGAVQLAAGGTGGGGGGGSGQGGGGGGGGGVLFVSARVFAGTGSIQARGGNGATGSSGNSGGGGGGGGGLVLVVSQSVSAGAISGQTIDANGGTKGSPIGTGTNNATDGSVGTVILVAN